MGKVTFGMMTDSSTKVLLFQKPKWQCAVSPKKCGMQLDGVSALESSFGVKVIIKRLSNIGRCDHTYALSSVKY